jgi:hypothetical protein
MSAGASADSNETAAQVPDVGPFGINDRGQIAGGYYDAAGKQHGFLLERGNYKTLDAPRRTDNIAWAINNRGQVIIPEGTARLIPVATQ